MKVMVDGVKECMKVLKTKGMTLSKLKAYKKVAEMKLEKMLELYEDKKRKLKRNTMN